MRRVSFIAFGKRSPAASVRVRLARDLAPLKFADLALRSPNSQELFEAALL